MEERIEDSGEIERERGKGEKGREGVC